MKKKLAIAISLSCCMGLLYGQQKTSYDLFTLATENKLQTVHRSIQPLIENGYKGIRVSQDSSEGLVWIKDIDFSTGSISFDTKGKDEFQRSFIGVVFHGQKDTVFDAVYFRPFNFYAKDSMRRIHAVQYISHPLFTWKKLRDEKNAQFEKAILNAPDPNGWFHVKITVKDKTVRVYVNNQTEPVLTVKQISNFSNGKIGLFTGDGSGGDFANLEIIKE
jgi:hypothetical protein